jgi:hypothetical protein
MRFLKRAIVVGLLICIASAASAQRYCPVFDFCNAQRDDCYRNCGALTDVVIWPQRPIFVQQCGGHCAANYDRCLRRVARFCPPAR